MSSSSSSSCPKTPKIALPTKNDTTLKKTIDESKSTSVDEPGHVEKCNLQTDKGDTKTPGVLKSSGVFVTPSTAGTRSDESIQLSTGRSETLTDPVQNMQTPSSQIKTEELNTLSIDKSSAEETSRRLAFASPPAGLTSETTPKSVEKKSNPKGTNKRKQRQTMPDLSPYYSSNERLTISPHESLDLATLPKPLQPTFSPSSPYNTSNDSVVVNDGKCNDEENATEPKSKRRKL